MNDGIDRNKVEEGALHKIWELTCRSDDKGSPISLVVSIESNNVNKTILSSAFPVQNVMDPSDTKISFSDRR